MKNTHCNLCIRGCPADRTAGELGFCGSPALAVVSHISRHFFEEPPISGTEGSGTIFFGGCNMRCVFCQNKVISEAPDGRLYDRNALSELILKVGESGVHNINLVTPTPHLNTLIPALEKARPYLKVPVVYNTSSYETEESLDRLSSLVDVWLPDLKYFSEDASVRYSNAPGYFCNAIRVIEKMLALRPVFSLTEEGILSSGVIVRHLALPSLKEDSRALLEALASLRAKYDFRISLMSQYTPDFLGKEKQSYKEISRRLTSLEYNRLLDYAISLGLDGYFQGRESASSVYTPPFNIKEFKEKEPYI